MSTVDNIVVTYLLFGWNSILQCELNQTAHVWMNSRSDDWNVMNVCLLVFMNATIWPLVLLKF